jgi:large subunit ribosomal protein L25
MTNPLLLTSTLREGRGKGPNRRLRAAGSIPAVLYGHGVDAPVSVTLDPRALDKALENPKGANAVLDVLLDSGTTHRVFARQIQRDAVSRRILHLDLVAPDLTKPTIFVVPLVFSGRSIGVSTGGRLRTPYRDMNLRSRPDDVMANVTIDITKLDNNDQVMASQVTLPEGVEAIFDRDYLVVKVVAPRGKKADPAADKKAAKKKK